MGKMKWNLKEKSEKECERKNRKGITKTNEKVKKKKKKMKKREVMEKEKVENKSKLVNKSEIEKKVH